MEDAVRGALKDKDERVRLAAIDAVGSFVQRGPQGPGRRRGSPWPVDTTDVADEVRSRALQVAKNVTESDYQRKLVPFLADVMHGDKRGTLRADAAAVLGRMGPNAKTAVNIMVESLKDPEPAVRAAAAEGLGRIGEEAKGSIPKLAVLLKDSDAGVRLAAAFALGRIGPDAASAVPDLAAALGTDPNANVRKEAARACSLLGLDAKPATPALAKALRADKSEEVRQQAALALGKMRGDELQEAIPAMLEAMKKDSDKSVRIFVVHSLGNSLGDGLRAYVRTGRPVGQGHRRRCPTRHRPRIGRARSGGQGRPAGPQPGRRGRPTQRPRRSQEGRQEGDGAAVTSGAATFVQPVRVARNPKDIQDRRPEAAPAETESKLPGGNSNPAPGFHSVSHLSESHMTRARRAIPAALPALAVLAVVIWVAFRPSPGTELRAAPTDTKAAPAPAKDVFAETVRPVFTQFCVACHNDKKVAGGSAWSRTRTRPCAAGPATCGRRSRSNSPPRRCRPRTSPSRPTSSASRSSRWIDARGDEGRLRPGARPRPPTIRRLNRASTTTPSATCSASISSPPRTSRPTTSATGSTTSATCCRCQPILLEKYLAAAESDPRQGSSEVPKPIAVVKDCLPRRRTCGRRSARRQER